MAFSVPNYGLYANDPLNLNTIPAEPKIVIALDVKGSNTNTAVIIAQDARVSLIENYLKKYKSPLAAKAKIFVDKADQYQIDWRLLPAISVIESSGGVRIPYGSYNAWGWGIPTGKGSGITFKSWDEAIETISKALKEKYIDKGLDTPEKMNRKYAASKTWGTKVRSAMTKIYLTNQI